VYDSLTLANATLADGSRADIRLQNGVITEISAVSSLSSPRSRSVRELADADLPLGDRLLAATESGIPDIDATGVLVLPALVNGHAHLDKTFVGTGWQPHRVGVGVPARVSAERSIRAGLTAGVSERARALTEEMIRLGTGAVRTHVDIDTELGLGSLHSLLELREETADRLTMQVVAFPQSGILADRGVAGLLDAALADGADVIGGLDPFGYDRDEHAHLDIVFSLAEKHGAGVDIHLHDLGGAAVRQLAQIARRTQSLGLGGRVVVSHGYGLGSIPQEQARRIGSALAAAGVAVMTNGPAGPMPPVLALREEGVVVFSGSDNIRDAWWPYGDGDMLGVARTVAYQSNFRTDEELAVALDMVTDAAATALGLTGYGMRVGAHADLVLLDAAGAAAAVASPPPHRTVLHRGRMVSSTRLVTRSVPLPRPTERSAPSAALAR